MARLILKNGDGTPETIELSRLRTTIGRSARSDVCIPDAFASRLHAEVRQEGDSFWLQDLGSANGTRYNSVVINHAVPLSKGDEIKIGESVMVFDDDVQQIAGGATLIADRTEALDPSKTISFQAVYSPTNVKGQSLRERPSRLISKVALLAFGSHLDETLDRGALVLSLPCALDHAPHDTAADGRRSSSKYRNQRNS